MVFVCGLNGDQLVVAPFHFGAAVIGEVVDEAFDEAASSDLAADGSVWGVVQHGSDGNVGQ